MHKDLNEFTHGIFEFESIDDIPYDPNCSIRKHSRIIKTKEDKPGCDLHPVGTKGITVGGFIAANGQECYVIKWDNSPYKVPGADLTLGFVVSWKIALIDDINT